MSDKLSTHVRRIRDLKSRGVDFEIQAMYEVTELERMSVIWKADRSTSFETVITKERLCTVTRFRAFKKATSVFKRGTIEKLGLPCVCLLAVQNGPTRDRLLNLAMKFRDENGTEPTYQYIARFTRKAKTGPTRKQLLGYIDDLKRVIREAGGRVPSMTSGSND